MDSVAEEILREILLRLPTRDVASGRCVSRQWRRVLKDPSFIDLHSHGAHVVSGAGAQTVLLSRTRPLGKSPEIRVFNASAGNMKSMCCIAGLTPGYSLANVCNGFLCLAAPVPDLSWQPVFLCNPITGDKLQVPPPPRMGTSSNLLRHMYSMGYSPSTRQYKLFCLSFWLLDELALRRNILHVLTLGSGGDGVWRRHEGLFRCHGMGSIPALIDGRLYVLGMEWRHDTKPTRLLVVDVASETHHTYSLLRYKADDTVADILEPHGRPYIAVHELGPCRRRLCFWVMLSLQPPCWEQRYIFDMGATSEDIINHDHHPRAAWLDGDDGMLWYLYRDNVYKYDTTEGRRRQHSVSLGYSMGWDHQLQLSSPNDGRWDVFSGYRPNLLSPHDLATAPHQDEERFEHQVVHALRCYKSSKKRSCSPPRVHSDYQRAPKLQSVMPLIDESLRASPK